MIAPKSYTAIFKSCIDISETHKIFTFTTSDPFIFLPGQFISIKVSNTDRRSYSIASNPNINEITTIVDISPMGVGSKYLLSLKKGDDIKFYGPLGTLVLPNNYNEYSSFNFICTGTGITPFMPMLNELFTFGYSNNITVLYSEKISKNFVSLPEYPENFNIIKTVTRENSSNYLQGRVTKHLDIIDYSDVSLFYICGNFPMIKEVLKSLQSRKVPRNRIILESFYS